MKFNAFLKTIITSTAAVCFLGAAGCASVNSAPNDPFEKYNRKVFKFNQVVDRVAYRPAAKVYVTLTPRLLQRGIHNVLRNVYQAPVIINDVLQLNIPLAMQDIGRTAVNSTLGLGGLFDVAKHMGAPYHEQDFGLTLTRWGWKNSSYFLLPFYPVGTFRDLLGATVDYTYFLPWAYLKPEWASYSVYGLIFIDKRAAFLPSDQLVKDSFDPYVFMRDAYFQNRQKQVKETLGPYGRNPIEESENIGNEPIVDNK
jgi:phospholipid-binding lipoprotein MlaA